MRSGLIVHLDIGNCEDVSELRVADLFAHWISRIDNLIGDKSISHCIFPKKNGIMIEVEPNK